MKPNTCYCGCHTGEPPRLGTHTCPAGGCICLECLTFAVNEGGETVCSRTPEYHEGRSGWEYFTPEDTPGLAAL